jgi:glycosyltransferase involved in cell wall biosynthesis
VRLLWMRPHVVHLNYVGYGPSLACAAWLCGIPVVARAGRYYVARSRGSAWIAAYLANCDAQAADLLRSPLADRVVVVGDLLRPERLDIPAIRDIPPCRPGALRILFLGQLVQRKGIAVLVEAFARVRAHADLLLVGGDWNQPGYPQQIGDLIHRLALGDRVRLENHREDAGALLLSSDIFVLPSYEEARPRTIIEASLLGVPVIASATGGIPSMVEDGVTGLLVPPGDVDALAKAIESLAANENLRRQFAENARARAERDCRPEETARRYLAVYRHLARRPHPQPGELQLVFGRDGHSS